MNFYIFRMEISFIIVDVIAIIVDCTASTLCKYMLRFKHYAIGLINGALSGNVVWMIC